MEIQDGPIKKLWSVLHFIKNYKITLKNNNYPRTLKIGDNQETVQLQIR